MNGSTNTPARRLRLLAHSLHAAANALEENDECRASDLLSTAHEAFKAGEPAQDWETLVQLLESHVARLQNILWPSGEGEGSHSRQDQQEGGPGTPLAFSPWGCVLERHRVTSGVTYLTTERHGGYHLTPDVNTRIPAEGRRADGFYEQDVQGALGAYFVPFSDANRADVLVMIETQYPEIYARIVRGELGALAPDTAPEQGAFVNARQRLWRGKERSPCAGQVSGPPARRPSSSAWRGALLARRGPPQV